MSVYTYSIHFTQLTSKPVWPSIHYSTGGLACPVLTSSKSSKGGYLAFIFITILAWNAHWLSHVGQLVINFHCLCMDSAFHYEYAGFPIWPLTFSLFVRVVVLYSWYKLLFPQSCRSIIGAALATILPLSCLCLSVWHSTRLYLDWNMEGEPSPRQTCPHPEWCR